MPAESPLSWIECQKYPRTVSSAKIFRLAKSKLPSWKIAPHTTMPVGSNRKTPTYAKKGTVPTQASGILRSRRVGRRPSQRSRCRRPHLPGGPDQEIALVQFAFR
jgi:hypothetical protein